MYIYIYVCMYACIVMHNIKTGFKLVMSLQHVYLLIL